ncbi:hypothetical protein EYF80_030682 [Liparis tanakae]|uniref:Uncharacterized protein n=1 Tax=Liparis tanakae TaxID=230148 RepID=A0A4Z2GZW9_9TELE|nr:hypothetical protein EYF80_030682 [Liparis tanakae]
MKRKKEREGRKTDGGTDSEQEKKKAMRKYRSACLGLSESWIQSEAADEDDEDDTDGLSSAIKRMNQGPRRGSQSAFSPPPSRRTALCRSPSKMAPSRPIDATVIATTISQAAEVPGGVLRKKSLVSKGS